MTTTRLPKDRLPYGVGHIGRGWAILAVIAAVMLFAGIYAYTRQLIDGEAVTGLADIGTGGGATWGLYVIFLVYFIGVSFAGISIAAITRLFNVEQLKPITRIALLITIISIFLGALLVIIDLGQPLRGLTNLWLYAMPSSPAGKMPLFALKRRVNSNGFIDRGRQDTKIPAGSAPDVNAFRGYWHLRSCRFW